MTIGERLNFVREKANISLKETVKRLKDAEKPYLLTVQTLSRYENGNRTPDNDFLEAFGKCFNISGDWLLYGEPPIFKVTGLERDVKETFLELSSLLNADEQKEVLFPEKLRLSLEKMTEATPENYMMLLSYMMKAPELRRDVLKFFYLFAKPAQDDRERRFK